MLPKVSSWVQIHTASALTGSTIPKGNFDNQDTCA